MAEMRNEYNILVRKHEVKRPSGRRRHRREDNIRTDLRETVWEGVECGLIWLRIGIIGGLL
jgi:hypothetical protein